MKLKGKVAIISGVSPNIMGGIAEGLADEGAKIVAADLNPEYTKACAEHIQKRGGQAVGASCDVTNEDQVKAAVDLAREAFGGVDILVNGAVIQIQKNVLDMPLDSWRRQLDVILTGAFLFTKYAAQSMIDQGRKGSIINITTAEAHQAKPNAIGYHTGKAGLLHFTRAVAMELAPYGIRVNSLTPIATDPTEGFKRAEEWKVEWPSAAAWDKPLMLSGATSVIEGRRKAHPMQRLPSPRHYARAAVFLASDDAEFINGFDLRVDGGAMVRHWGWHPGMAGT